MKQLSGADSMFLQFERRNNFMHVASLSIYDPSTAPGGGVRFKDILQLLRHARRAVPPVPPPARLAAAVARSAVLDRVADDRRRVPRAAHRAAAPGRLAPALHPGGTPAFPPARSQQAVVGGVRDRGPAQRARRAARQLRALYEAAPLRSSTASPARELMKALHSLSPEPVDFDGAKRNAAQRLPRRSRTDAGRAVLARAHRTTFSACRRWRTSPSAPRARSRRSARRPSPSSAARARAGSWRACVRCCRGTSARCCRACRQQTRFSGDVSAHRVFEAVSFPLCGVPQDQAAGAEGDDQRPVPLHRRRRAARVPVGQEASCPRRRWSRWCRCRCAARTRPATTATRSASRVMPVHTRNRGRRSSGCARSSTSAEKSKRMTRRVGREIARDLLETMPSMIADPLIRNAQVPRIGLVVSNVRGPDVPLYMAGAQLVNYVPISIVIDGVGLNVTAFSYAGNMWICAISCRDMLPDPAFFADCLRASFDQMKEGALREAAFTVAESEARRRRARPAVARRGSSASGRRRMGTRGCRSRQSGEAHAEEERSVAAQRARSAAASVEAKRRKVRRAAVHASAGKAQRCERVTGCPPICGGRWKRSSATPVDDVVLREHSMFARLHGRARATTRRNTIYLRGSLRGIFRRPGIAAARIFPRAAAVEPRPHEPVGLPRGMAAPRLLAEPVRAAGEAVREVATPRLPTCAGRIRGRIRPGPQVQSEPGLTPVKFFKVNG